MPATHRRVLVLGDVNADLTLHVPARLPDGRREVREPVVSLGGTAANTARALASLGVPVAFAGAVGDDGFGRWAREALGAAGVDTEALVVLPSAPTAQVIAMLEPDGERSLVVWPPDGGALRWLRRGDVDADVVRTAAWLHTTGMCLRDPPVRDAVLEAMATAREAGVPTSLDLNLRIELWGLGEERRAVVERAIGLADVVFGSGPEELVPLASGVEAQTEAPPDRADEASVAHAARTLAGGARTVIARLGSGGAVACTADGRLVHSAAFAVTAANPVGAGDAFDAGFIAAMVEGRGLADALRWGNAVAALRVGIPVGSSGLPGRREVEELLAR